MADSVVVARDSLIIGNQLGEGAQGRVFALRNRDDLVYKEYFQVRGGKIDGAGLDRLVRWRLTLDADSQHELDDRAAWLVGRVVHASQTVGVTMSRIPQDFMCQVAAGEKPQGLVYLLYPPRPAWSTVPLPSDEQRLMLAREVLKLVEFLHSDSHVLGDISMNNFLWTLSPRPRVFLIDCDSVRRSGYHAPVAQLDTPDWDDPHHPHNSASLDSDRYKVALAVIRVLTRNAYVRPGSSVTFLPGIPGQVTDRVGHLARRAAGTRGSRPTVSEWLQALSGRPTVSLSRMAAPKPVPQRQTGVVQQRPQITLRPKNGAA